MAELPALNAAPEQGLDWGEDLGGQPADHRRQFGMVGGGLDQGWHAALPLGSARSVSPEGWLMWRLCS
jgi:hypothetical protein